MPSILIDTYKTNDIYSGLGQFSYNFAKYTCNAMPEKYKLYFLGKSDVLVAEKTTHTFVPVSWQKRYFPFLNEKYDVWHSLHQFPSHKPSKHSIHILTIHDLNFLVEKKSPKANHYLKKLQKNINNADALTAISDFTKQLVINNLDTKDKPVHTIYNGVELKVFENARKPDYIENDEFFFSIGVVNQKKNFHVLIPLMHAFADMKLIIAGNKDSTYAREIEEIILKNNLENRVVLPGKISDEDKYWLYSNCKAFLFPSIAEGFGLPVIEAMLAGKPVFLSRHASLPEIGGNVAYYWDNFDVNHMTEILLTKLNDFNSNREEVSRNIMKHAQKFSWKICAQQYLKLYSILLG